MTDPKTRDRVSVLTDGTAGPYIIVHETQAQIVRVLLTSRNIPHEEKPGSIRDKADSDTIFDLGNGADIKAVQALLDSID
jgi:hypothetical protein